MFEGLARDLMIGAGIFIVLAFCTGFGCHYLFTKMPTIKIELEHKK